MEENLFAMSVSKCQKLIDVMLEYENDEGVCVVSQTELAKRLSLAQTNISNTIKKVNIEDLCIEILSPGFYKVHYKNLLACGTFSCIWNLMLDAKKDYRLVFEKDQVIADRYAYKLKTVQIFKSCIKTGWLKHVT
jgi:hypothetical protein